MKETSKQQKFWETGLSWPLIIFLAALTIPRVLGHDLQWTEEGSLVNSLLALIPLMAWVSVVLWKRVPNPFKALLVIGLVHGIFLAITHQFTWNSFWGDDMPRLEGNLEGQLSPAIENLVLRSAAFISSVLTGVFTGAVIGGLTWVLSRTVGKPVKKV